MVEEAPLYQSHSRWGGGGWGWWGGNRSHGDETVVDESFKNTTIKVVGS